jgi:hypothetical protein
MKIAVLWRSLSIEKKLVVNFAQRGDAFLFYGEKEIFTAISAWKDKILGHTSWYWH